MIIKQITYQSRRDFKAIYICERCNKEEEKWGYDDMYFHNKVTPEMFCNSCNVNRLGVERKALTPE